MNRKIIPSLLALMLAVMACNIPSALPAPTVSIPARSTDTPVPPTPTITTITTTPEPSAPGDLRLDKLMNGTYDTPVYGHTVTLVNGSYSEGSGANAFSVQMLGVYALGDLNGDGNADAAIILVENGGGSGEFESVIAVINQGGVPHQESQASLGDRVQIKSVNISSGVIHLDMLVQGLSDPMCCPSMPQKQNYWLIDNRLWLMHLESTINGMDHAIVIESPVVWATVTNPFNINGSISILPFENTLAYRIFFTDGKIINESSLTVTPAKGTTGEFSQVFNLSSAGITDWVIVQFVDASAADGSTIALGSVILKAR